MGGRRLLLPQMVCLGDGCGVARFRRSITVKIWRMGMAGV